MVQDVQHLFRLLNRLFRDLFMAPSFSLALVVWLGRQSLTVFGTLVQLETVLP